MTKYNGKTAYIGKTAEQYESDRKSEIIWDIEQKWTENLCSTFNWIYLLGQGGLLIYI